jgi:hypothetical protein
VLFSVIGGYVFLDFAGPIFPDNRSVHFPKIIRGFFGYPEAGNIVVSDKLFYFDVKILQHTFVAAGEV